MRVLMQKGWNKNPFLILLCMHWFDPCPLVIIRNQTDPRCRLVQSKARRFSTEPCEKSKKHTIEKSLSILFYAIHAYVFQTSHLRCDGLYAQITSRSGTAYYHYWFFFPFSFLSFSSTDPKFLSHEIQLFSSSRIWKYTLLHIYRKEEENRNNE